jgi:ABC-type Mn2+/Zn2+ transport system ATPase subunit
MEAHWPMSGFDAASMALSARRPLGRIGRREAGQVREAMEAMGVADLARRAFATLSGGQQQRLLLAGALAAGPDVLVLDEPTDGLDARSRDALLDVLRGQNRAGVCTVMISHDVEDLLRLADRIALLRPPDDPGRPSRAEVIGPDELRDRVLNVRRAS